MDVEGEVFPREVAKYNFAVETFQDFLDYYYEKKDTTECWSMVYSNWQILNGCVDTILFDIDKVYDCSFQKLGNDSKKETLRTIRLFVDGLVELFPKVRVYYTGGTGFHVYVDFTRNIQLYDPRSSLKKFMYYVLSEHFGNKEPLPLKFDISTFMRKKARIVGSKGKFGDYMIRLPVNGSLSDWMFCMEENIHDLITDKDYSGNKFEECEILDKLIQIDDEVFRSREERVREKEDIIDGRIKVVPPCVGKCVAILTETGELDHQGRVLLATFLIHHGYSDDDIVHVFKVAKDFNERYTRYQVEHLRRNGYKPYKCKNIMALGYCPYKCELYPWMLVKRK